MGLLYYQARYYLPGIGRFASADTIVPDPANPQSLNRYTYVLNSAVNRVDPTGHVACNLLDGGADTQACNDGKTNAATFSTSCSDCGWSDTWGNMEGAYETFVELEETMGRPMTYEEMLALSIAAEFGSEKGGDYFSLYLEGLGRQFWERCPSGRCQGEALWQLLGGLEVWYSTVNSVWEYYRSERYEEYLGEAQTILNHISWRNGAEGDRAWTWGARSLLGELADNLDDRRRFQLYIPENGRLVPNGIYTLGYLAMKDSQYIFSYSQQIAKQHGSKPECIAGITVSCIEWLP